MTEPTSAATASVVVPNVINTTLSGAGVIVFGVHTGLDYPTLIAGVVGGALALTYQEKANGWLRAFQVITAALFAGYSTPSLVGIAVSILGKWSLVDQQESTFGLRVCVSFITAYLTHGVLLPGIRQIGTAFLRKQAE